MSLELLPTLTFRLRRGVGQNSSKSRQDVLELYREVSERPFQRYNHLLPPLLEETSALPGSPSGYSAAYLCCIPPRVAERIHLTPFELIALIFRRAITSRNLFSEWWIRRGGSVPSPPYRSMHKTSGSSAIDLSPYPQRDPSGMLEVCVFGDMDGYCGSQLPFQHRSGRPRCRIDLGAFSDQRNLRCIHHLSVSMPMGRWMVRNRLSCTAMSSLLWPLALVLQLMLIKQARVPIPVISDELVFTTAPSKISRGQRFMLMRTKWRTK